MKRVFVLTDNVSIYTNFRDVLDNVRDVEFEVSYAYSPSSESLFLELKDIESFDIKKDYKSLIGNVDLIISCHCKKIFPAELVNKVKCINIHPGLNPYNRGWYPQVFAINNGMPHGATIHEMDEEIDHGNIIAQEEIKIEQTDTSKSVYDKVVLAELKMFKQHVSSLISGTYKAKKMVHEGNYNSISDFNELCKIDMNK
ncbi:TPA: hypothetical protein PX766_002745, partial [Vibrio cholerae]|nr:hypothetical protein [Vibrio cholerae]